MIGNVRENVGYLPNQSALASVGSRIFRTLTEEQNKVKPWLDDDSTHRALYTYITIVA